MATFTVPKIGEKWPENQDQDRLVKKLDNGIVQVEVFKLDKNGRLIGSNPDVKMPSSDLSDEAWIKKAIELDTAAQVRAGYRQSNFVRIRAAIGASKNGRSAQVKKGY